MPKTGETLEKFLKNCKNVQKLGKKLQSSRKNSDDPEKNIVDEKRTEISFKKILKPKTGKILEKLQQNLKKCPKIVRKGQN